MDQSIKSLFDDYYALAGSAEAAATLVLADVNSRQREIEQSGLLHAPNAYLSVKEAAKRFSLGTRTVYRIVEQGLPVIRAGKAIRIKTRDLEHWLAGSETILH